MQTNNEMFEKIFDILGGGGSRKITFDHKGGGGPKWPKKRSRDFRTAPIIIIIELKKFFV
jgi:hypothetical protein